MTPDEWEDYVRRTIDKYGFDAAQINSARAVLNDVQARAHAVRRSQKGAREKLDGVSDTQEGSKKLQALDEPIRALFKELQDRLDKLATEDQRRRAEGR